MEQLSELSGRHFCKKDCILLNKYRTINDQLFETSGDMHVGTGHNFRISVIKISELFLLYLSPYNTDSVLYQMAPFSALI